MEKRSTSIYDSGMEHLISKPQDTAGAVLRMWRKKRHMSQLDLASDANISTRHLSFVETGRSRPSREVLLRLAECLSLPFRETSALLLAAGLAPDHSRTLPQHDPYSGIEGPVALLLEGHAPYPAIAIDRYWTIRKSNRAAQMLLANVASELLAPPLNAIRISLHPNGLAPHIENFDVWREHLLRRLRHQIQLTGDMALKHLLDEVSAYSGPSIRRTSAHTPLSGPVVPLRLRFDGVVLNLISTTTIFGSPINVEVAELAIETFFPGDEATRQILISLG